MWLLIASSLFPNVKSVFEKVRIISGNYNNIFLIFICILGYKLTPKMTWYWEKGNFGGYFIPPNLNKFLKIIVLISRYGYHLFQMAFILNILLICYSYLISYFVKMVIFINKYRHFIRCKWLWEADTLKPQWVG